MKFTLYPLQAIWELGQRQNQEDAIYPKLGEATTADRLFILCDGMGGHEKGEVASNTVSKSMAEFLVKNAGKDAVAKDETLLAALEYAYQQLDSLDDGAARKMGTTLCLLLFHRGGLTAMHIGDSRIYHIRPSEHRILYQSKDHSLVYDLYQAGEITYDEMRTSPQKNIITRAIQPGEDNRVRPSIVHIADIQDGDYFYVCSDGMLEQMENEELCNLLSAKGSDEKKRQQLIAATVDNKDNHSAYLIHINNVEHEAGDDDSLDDEQATPDNAMNIKPDVEPESEDVTVVSTHSQDAESAPQQPFANKKPRKPLVADVALAVVVLVVLAFVIVKPSKKGTGKEETDDKLELVKERKAPPSSARIGTLSRSDKKAQPTKKIIVVTKEPNPPVKAAPASTPQEKAEVQHRADSVKKDNDHNPEDNNQPEEPSK